MGLGSGIWKKPIPDPVSRGQKGTRSQILDLDPQHCLLGKEVGIFIVELFTLNCSHLGKDPS
jgi:hypothetical protein